ncbi:MAG: LLM class flavin-dependent oxidoreductase, partial [Dietzia sp.]|nr:LLM class flavin-dependent oxidoreductase [Dietzia sp.]
MSSNILGRFGFTVDTDDDGGSAAQIERLGFGALWITGGQLDRLDRLTDLLSSTRTAVVGSAIIPPDLYDPAAVSRLYEHAQSIAPGRLLIGLGSSQQAHALTRLSSYIDRLDAVPQD